MARSRDILTPSRLLPAAPACLQISLFLFFVGVPPGFVHRPFCRTKISRNPAGGRRSLAVDLGFENLAAPDDGDAAEMLHRGARKFKADQFPALGVKSVRRLEHDALAFPFVFADACDDRSATSCR